MAAVASLSDLISSTVRLYLEDTEPFVKDYSTYLVFDYKLNIGTGYKALIESSIDRVVKLVFGLNDKLKYKIFKASNKTGKLIFNITSVDISHKDYTLEIKVGYTYLHTLYLDIIHKELNILILSKLDKVQNLCKAISLCEDPGVWKEVFRVRYPQLYNVYVKLNLQQHLNMASYLAYLQFEEDISSDIMVPGLHYSDFLDFYTIRYRSNVEDLLPLKDIGLTNEDLISMTKVIFNIKHTRLDKIMNLDETLRGNISLMGDVLEESLDMYAREDNVIPPISDVIYNNSNVNTSEILSKELTLKSSLIKSFHSGFHDVIYLFLLTLNFNKITPVMDTILYILSTIKRIDSEIGFPRLKIYINKIKSENIELYNKIKSSCNTPSEEYTSLCEVINRL